VKKVVQKYEDKIMPKPKTNPKPKPSNYSEETEGDEDIEQGNSKMLQNLSGKIKKR
jgi:hypothetical protein